MRHGENHVRLQALHKKKFTVQNGGEGGGPLVQNRVGGGPLLSNVSFLVAVSVEDMSSFLLFYSLLYVSVCGHNSQCQSCNVFFYTYVMFAAFVAENEYFPS